VVSIISAIISKSFMEQVVRNNGFNSISFFSPTYNLETHFEHYAANEGNVMIYLCFLESVSENKYD
jgi:hypothetical protein